MTTLETPQLREEIGNVLWESGRLFISGPELADAVTPVIARLRAEDAAEIERLRAELHATREVQTAAASAPADDDDLPLWEEVVAYIATSHREHVESGTLDDFPEDLADGLTARGLIRPGGAS